ncbi:bifunctional alpha,alpha-trehalose-phosphate synthase (UDP-forming)/trehalose-phosphatase [Flavobacterium salilacus subsp. salilacus]|uniref:bifunctional alpha,alpha-trehalose-phosphate synthase (UDP-forming)/trehalose-phosphatase n=1 Tax=Flavobacterium TaxID=237 RepID=UPI0010750353|nr:MULTISPECIES: bifunctional alpha,alpha-trehalose-phosphate synthase (UDP-forming)/trehalose-phosphatase [Flavobacterium]KAF2518716.1 bifunctional alpha,alpha-trehalose-phosphate synthase (UDP-forming)/trehalose-phosphatase [Flavobacterium salilacus subsp. salilacus]MBE1613681.1 bifunctional alpha,alpha-trehalose-phosphate synthase (UDP-forming)/trehalose-phosphatase [Flavobacterium sp. SaA2.13]
MKIITVSYRLPLSIKKTKGKAKITQSAGGLATAILSYSAKSNVNLTWVGIADFDSITWNENKDKYDQNFDIEPVFLEEELNQEFYNVFSNSVLWALFHYFPSFVEYTDDGFEAYKQANEIVAKKVSSIYEPGDVIWIHDYHFLGLPNLLREAHPDAKIGYFLHIPFPNFEIFRILPNKVKRYILEGILGSNVAGFHTWDNTIHFTECVEKILGIPHKNFLFSQESHRTKAGSFPISIDFDKFHNAYNNEEVINLRSEIKKLYGDKKIIFSVDRLDYTKGITNRLNAFEKFLEKYPEWSEKVVFLLVLVPSREEIKKYDERKKLIEHNVGHINGNMGNYKWTPIVYQYQSVSFEKLIALYTSADVALISPVRDGMNLVAKEFVASRKDLKGVLILSSMAGAAKDLKEAITINPFDAEMIAKKLCYALTMDEAEQALRLARMQRYLKKHDVFRWAEKFLTEVEEIHKNDTKAVPLKGKERDRVLQKFNEANKRLLLLDFDGTLVNLQSRPELAVPDEELLDTLNSLAEEPKNEVWIVSGRNKDFLEKWLGHLPIGIIAEHGGYVKNPEWKPVIIGEPEWKDQVIDIMQDYVDTNAESFIEVKEFGIAYHYRNVAEKQGFNTSRELLMLLKNHMYNTPTQIIDGNKVIEVKHFMAHKGTTCKNNVLRGEHDFVLAFGDDKTDEDLFELLTSENEFSVKVGKGNTAAKYRLETVEEVLVFLSELDYKSVLK